LRLLVQLAALAVVEGVFLSAWWALDTDRAAPTAVKTRHAITALAMYSGLWVLAIQHGEGLAELFSGWRWALPSPGRSTIAGYILPSERMRRSTDRR